MFEKSSNPVMREASFSRLSTHDEAGVMTIRGTVGKTAILLLLAVASASYTWKMFFEGHDMIAWTVGGLIGGLVFALVTIFSPKYSHITAPLYALFEGLFLGAISAVFAASYEGIVLNAVLLTVLVFVTMLFIYMTGIIKVTGKFMKGVIAATMGVALFYFLLMILNLFGIGGMFYMDSSPLAIGINLLIVGIAALNLVLDFHFIEEATKKGASQRMEWYAAFGLMVTLVWLYIELLRLLSRFSSRE